MAFEELTMSVRLRRLLSLLLLLTTSAAAQVVPNRGLLAADLQLAQTIALEAGGAAAELTYANRIDLVNRTEFDSLLVVYAVRGEDRAVIDRGGARHSLVVDGEPRVIPSGDTFRRSGLRRPPSGPAILRLISTFRDPQGEEWQRNLDFQFNGKEFVIVGQSTTR